MKFEQEIKEIAQKYGVSIFVAADVWALRQKPAWTPEQEAQVILKGMEDLSMPFRLPKRLATKGVSWLHATSHAP